MRKLKQISALLLVFAILLLSGCADIKALIQKGNDSDFYEITAISEKATDYASVDIMGDLVLFLSSKGIEEYELTVYNAKRDRIVAETSLASCPIENIYGARFSDENEVIVYDDYERKAVAYDLELNFIGETEYKNSYDPEYLPQSTLLNDRYGYMDTCAIAYENDSIYCVFFDELDNVYIFGDYDKNFVTECGKSLLLDENIYDENFDFVSAKLAVVDTANACTVNELDLGKDLGYYFAERSVSAMSDTYACFVVCYTNERTGAEKYTPYLWKYNENAKNEPIEIAKKSESDLEEENVRFINEIENKYGIDVKINEPAQFVSYEEDYTASAIEVNTVLAQLVDCLALFPDNFIKEIYNADYVEGLNLHIIENIVGANAYVNDFTDVYEVVFGACGFSKGIVFHEFMHLIDNRLYDYYEDSGKDFYDMWVELNPEYFEYYSEEEFDFDEEYFVSYYAMTNEAEDMAETFQSMYETYSASDVNRFAEYEHINAKAALLCNAIREAFPSMAEAQDVCWEKYVNSEK